MSDKLARRQVLGGRLVADPRALRTAGVIGVALTTGFAVSAACAGVAQEVRLPDWWGPWPWRRPGALHGWVALDLVFLGLLCVTWAWLSAAVLRSRLAGGTRPASDGEAGRGEFRLRTVGLLAAASAVPLALGGPIGSLDVQSYAAVGRLVAQGFDPYAVPTAALFDRFSSAVDPFWRWTPTPYGPLQVQLLGALERVAGDDVGLMVALVRAVAILALLAALAVAVRAARPADRPTVLVLTALNPVVLVHVVSGAHLDVLVGALAVSAVGLARRGHPALAMAVAVAATAVKLPGAVLIAFVLLDVVRRRSGPARARALLAALGAGLAAVAALVELCPDPFGWVGALGVPGIARNGVAPSTWTAYLVAALTGRLSGTGLTYSFTVGRAAIGVLGVGAVVVLLWRSTSGPARTAFSCVGWALLVLALSGPSVYPWYLTWGLFLAAVGSGPRGRMLLVLLSSATCLASALGDGWVVLVLWLSIQVAVLAFSTWTGLDHLRGRRVAVRHPPQGGHPWHTVPT
jgi:hypothetical protein